MADVYEGVDTRLGRPVAVKVFRPGSEPQSEDRHAAEAVLLARLEHPGLVTVYDTGCHDDRAYLVMQLVDGPTLRGLLTRGALPEGRVARLGTALARALAHVHGAGIVHRDVKPSNVLLDAAGAPHLADFGIARLANATRRTAPDVLTGTAAYLAPEQVEGGHVGAAADVYALGLVLLECLKGELEYQGNPLEAAIARLHRPPRVPAGLCPELAELLRAMTARDPGARPDAERCAQVLRSLDPGSDPRPLSRSTPALAGPPAYGAAHAHGGEPTHRRALAVTRSHPAGGARHHRRMAVGTALAALSVALGTTLAVAPGTSGNSDDRADAPRTATRPSSGTADPGTGPAAAPSAEPRRDQRSPGESGASGPAAGPGAEPVSMRWGSSESAAPADRAPARQHGAASRKPVPHRKDTGDHPHRTPRGAAKPPGKAGEPPRHPAGKGHG
ncbi:serine/threonine protein kinase [Streptomyces lucensis JCM 4490]|uniref:non-specific serine/threonine protein kinase n=2 Tax=Streptomyces lucensis TaxID=67319 RepID=A0A918MPU6_9ACTN|nr:serine/threonine protein kinase [Streptomyces lucensis JCM 4490]